MTVRVVSTPAGADVFLDGEPISRGKTPLTLTLPRSTSDNMRVVVRLKGYERADVGSHARQRLALADDADAGRRRRGRWRGAPEAGAEAGEADAVAAASSRCPICTAVTSSIRSRADRRKEPIGSLGGRTQSYGTVKALAMLAAC